MFRSILLCLGLCFAVPASAASIHENLHINRGTYWAVDSSNFIYIAFNAISTFDKQNLRIHIDEGDSLILHIYNNDSVDHGFNITDQSGLSTIIPAGDSAVVAALFSSVAIHIYYDDANYPNNRYLGLGGMIVVEKTNAAGFYWNIKEHQKTWNDSIADSGSVDWTMYYPDYFTINGNSNPDINTDSSARVVGNVGDTIHIYMANTGQSAHSIHFHGYHSRITYSNKNAAYIKSPKAVVVTNQLAFSLHARIIVSSLFDRVEQTCVKNILVIYSAVRAAQKNS